MGYEQVQQNYLKNQVMSATPAKLIELLLVGALKQVHVAKQALADQRVEAAHKALMKAQDIILELRYDVKEDVDAQIGQRLIEFYRYMNKQLIKANQAKDATPLVDVEAMLTEYLDAWKQVEEQV